MCNNNLHNFKGLLHLTAVLTNDVDKYTKAGAIWAIGMIGQHSPEHSRHVADSGALNSMMDVRKQLRVVL